MTTPARIEPIRSARGYTLFEILLALGIVAVLLGIAVPMVSNSFQESESETVSKLVEQTVKSTHAAALETGEAKFLGLDERGLVSRSPGIPGAELPKGWKLQVRRFTETRFRPPERGETWEINGAGICEPISLKLGGEEESVVLQFDPLTAQLLPAND
jgi:prepilin-type N-terminal cleavage/methylation domain-containing protein